MFCIKMLYFFYTSLRSNFTLGFKLWTIYAEQIVKICGKSTLTYRDFNAWLSWNRRGIFVKGKKFDYCLSVCWSVCLPVYVCMSIGHSVFFFLVHFYILHPEID